MSLCVCYSNSLSRSRQPKTFSSCPCHALPIKFHTTSQQQQHNIKIGLERYQVPPVHMNTTTTATGKDSDASLLQSMPPPPPVVLARVCLPLYNPVYLALRLQLQAPIAIVTKLTRTIFIVITSFEFMNAHFL